MTVIQIPKGQKTICENLQFPNLRMRKDASFSSTISSMLKCELHTNRAFRFSSIVLCYPYDQDHHSS